MAKAGVQLPQGTMEEFVALRVPRKRPVGVDTEFHAWSNQEVQARLVQGKKQNVGEIRLGDDVQATRIAQEFPGLTGNQVRIIQLRGIIHELFHSLDFGDVIGIKKGDHDAAIGLQGQHLGFGQNLPGYARNEIATDMRTGLVLERNGLLFAELRQTLDQYRAYWEAQNPMSEQAFGAVLAALNRTTYP